MSLVTDDGVSIARLSAGYRDQRVVFDGQSFNVVPGNGYGNYFDPSTAMPAQCMIGHSVAYTVPAVSGASWATLAATASTRLHPWADTAPMTVLMLTGGTQSIRDGLTGQQTYDAQVAYAEAARAAGFDLVTASTIPPMNILGHFDAGEETARQAHNALVMANADGDFDAVVDIASDPLDDPLDTTYFLGDRTHWTPAAAAIAGVEMRAALDVLI